jgi:TonB family protein
MSPEALISQASKLQELWTDGTPPVRVRAQIQVFEAKGVTEGQYIVNWVSPSRWREEVRFVNYERIRVYGPKGYWQKSGLSYQPEIIFQLDTMLNPNNVLKFGAKHALGKVRSREKHGIRERCTEVQWPTETQGILRSRWTDRNLCFDEATDSLVSVEYQTHANGNPPEISRIEYSAFNALGRKLVPFETRAFKEGKVIAAVKVLEMAKNDEEDPALFVAPPNSEFWAHCPDMQEAELVGRVVPKYPPSARHNFEQGRVFFYAVIEADGALSHLTLIQRATPDLESAAAEAIRQWHYKPASCGSTPIRVETSIPTDFWLQR